MPALSKFTTTYSESEDRLHLVGETAEGTASVALWLTQRLMNRLVTLITQCIEDDIQTQASHSLDVELHHAFAQEAATRQLEPSAPVPIPPEKPPILVASVNLLRKDSRYVMIFREEGDEENTDRPFIRASHTELRQWLGIVNRLYRDAGWPLDAWPKWFGWERTAAPQAVVLH